MLPKVLKCVIEDENIWLTQRMMAELYDVSVPAINQHIKRIYEDNELTPERTIKKYLIVQKEHMGLTTWENAPVGKERVTIP